MAASFQRTFAALEGDRRRAPLAALAAALLIFLAWAGWSFLAQISVYRSSERARIEVYPAPTRVAAPIAGRVTEVHLEVGAAVEAGAALVELDATAERIALEKAKPLAENLSQEVASAERELAAEEDAEQHGGASEREAERAVRARLRASDAELELAQTDLERERVLAETDASPRTQLESVRAKFKRSRAEFQAVRHESEALEAAHRALSDSRRARLEQLRRQVGGLSSELTAAKAEVSRLEFEIARHTIRAPIAGTLGEVIALRPGAVLEERAVVATVVPKGTLQVVAEFGAVSLGRLEPGQPARVRLDGFPSTRYGTLSAKVVRVASELREGTIRVELELLEPKLPDWVHHGMTGAADVEIERATPISLLARAVGEGLDQRRRD
ncbi:MAG: HlyD family efflux transporter periplasmic adaptor subunit [Myxococcota bacterium]